MIKDTNADCKLLKISVSESTATITLLIFATKSTDPSRSFKICLKDTDKDTFEEVNNNVYWIDQINNYNNDSVNIDTKKYKEIMFDVDITRKNTSDIQGKKWIRNCYIYLVDTAKQVYNAIAWSSGLITLISDEFEIPEITNISLSTKNITKFYLDQEDLTKTENRGQIQADFKLKYTSERDFNYNNENFKAYLYIRSVSTDDIIEKKEIVSSKVSLDNTILSTNKYSINTPVIVQIIITNKNGEIMNDYRKIYTPFKKYSDTYIKTENGVKKVIAYFVATDSNEEHEGEWLK